MITTIDKAGRIVVPKAIRDALHLKAGDELDIESDGDQVTIRHRLRKARLVQENGFWVVDTGGRPITNEMINQWIEEGREERHRRILGE